eukprot:TRINITY_DN2779_c0_g1_i2.p1 TRINITY_DN2779_c0_g1~~TRINITY_DN2779_c0_g1_i2.p1  ORF type:complete len:327 (+),score=91.63 TRINITY_DN2779_c0_g1_i2:79-1059(+)
MPAPPATVNRCVSDEKYVGRVTRVGEEPALYIDGVGEFRFAYRNVKKRRTETKPIVLMGDMLECRLTTSDNVKAVALRVVTKRLKAEAEGSPEEEPPHDEPPRVRRRQQSLPASPLEDEAESDQEGRRIPNAASCLLMRRAGAHGSAACLADIAEAVEAELPAAGAEPVASAVSAFQTALAHSDDDDNDAIFTYDPYSYNDPDATSPGRGRCRAVGPPTPSHHSGITELFGLDATRSDMGLSVGDFFDDSPRTPAAHSHMNLSCRERLKRNISNASSVMTHRAKESSDSEPDVYILRPSANDMNASLRELNASVRSARLTHDPYSW